VAAILAAAAPPPLAASEAAAAAAAAAAGQQGVQVEAEQPCVAAATATAAAAQMPPPVEGAAAETVAGAADDTQEAAAAVEPTAAPTATTTTAAAAAAASSGVGVGVTEYARSRPRREGAGGRLAQLGSTSESLELVAPLEFTGTPGSGVVGAQPYVVEVDLKVREQGGGCMGIGLHRLPRFVQTLLWSSGSMCVGCIRCVLKVAGGWVQGW